MRLKTGRVLRGGAPGWVLRVSLVVARRGIRKLTGSRGGCEGSFQSPEASCQFWNLQSENWPLESGNWELETPPGPGWRIDWMGSKPYSE